MRFRKLLLSSIPIALLTGQIATAYHPTVNNIYDTRNEVVVEIKLLWEDEEEWCYEIVGDDDIFCFHKDKDTRGSE